MKGADHEIGALWSTSVLKRYDSSPRGFALGDMHLPPYVNPLVAELFCHKLDLLEIVGFLCTFLQHAVC